MKRIPQPTPGESQGLINGSADAPLLLSVEAAADRLGIGVWSVRELVRAGTIPSAIFPSPANLRRPMRRVLIPASALAAFVESITEGGRR